MSLSQPFANNAEFSTWRPLIDPQSVYVHIPFCRRRCGYCNFSLVAQRDYLVDRFLAALKREISWLDRSYPIQTLFLGGGTPSHLTSDQLHQLKLILSSRFNFNARTEVTAECNPNDIDPAKAEALAEFGVNRISLGVQSFNQEKLKILEREHQPAEVASAVELSRRFAHSVSLDLMFAAPQETLAQWRVDLQTALELHPDHLSLYELTFEKGTQFWNRLQRQALTEADEDLRTEMYEWAIEATESAGLLQYEISSFSLPNHASRHNEVYWKGDPYFAFGPGASRYIDGCRQTNHQSTLHYIRRIERDELPISLSEKLSPTDSARELLAIGLRRVAGLHEAEFFNRTKFQVSDLLGQDSQTWIQQGLITHQAQTWKLTRAGRLVADWLATQIVSADQSPSKS